MDEDIYTDALLAQSSDSLIGIAFRLAEMVEVMKGGGAELVAHNPAVRVLVARMAWLCELGGVKDRAVYHAALDICLDELGDEREEMLEYLEDDFVKRMCGLE